MKGESYYIIYDWMVQAIGDAISVMAFALLYGLCTSNGGSCTVSNAYIAERIGCKERWARQIVNALIANGFITKKAGDGRGHASVYTITEKGEQSCHLSTNKGGIIEPPLYDKKGAQSCRKGGTIVPPIINNNKTSPTKGAHAHEDDPKAEPRQWLNDDEEFLTQRCMRNGIRIIGTARETMQPYIEEFIDVQLDLGTDFYLKGRQDTKRHFAAWLKKNNERITKKLNEDEHNRQHNDRRHPGDMQGQDTGAVLQRTYRLEYDPELGNAWRTQRSYF